MRNFILPRFFSITFLFISCNDKIVNVENDDYEWVDAEFIKTSGFSPRPGLHLTDSPFAFHIYGAF